MKTKNDNNNNNKTWKTEELWAVQKSDEVMLNVLRCRKSFLSNSKQMLTHVMCTNTLKKIHFLHAFDSFQPEWLLNVTWNIRYVSRETCVTILRTSEVEEVFQYYFGICPQHQKLTRINTCSWSMVCVWSWRKNFSFHVTHVSVSQFCG